MAIDTCGLHLECLECICRKFLSFHGIKSNTKCCNGDYGLQSKNLQIMPTSSHQVPCRSLLSSNSFIQIFFFFQYKIITYLLKCTAIPCFIAFSEIGFVAFFNCKCFHLSQVVEYLLSRAYQYGASRSFHLYQFQVLPRKKN